MSYFFLLPKVREILTFVTQNETFMDLLFDKQSGEQYTKSIFYYSTNIDDEYFERLSA